MQRQTFNILMATADDLDELQDVKRQAHSLYIQNRPDIYQESEILYTEDFIHDFYTNPNKMILIARSACKIKGYALIEKVFVNKPMLTPRGYIYIHDIAVAEESRNYGIGTGLLTEIERIALESGIPKLELAVHLFNINALSLYQKLGFMPRAYRMEKDIG